MSPQSRFRPLFVGAVTAALLALGCDGRRNVFQADLPWVNSRFVVDQVVERDVLLDAELEMSEGGTRLRVFAPAEGACAEVLQRGRPVVWKPSGAIGTVAAGDADCAVTGIGSLVLWRDRRPQAGLRATPIPRAQATFDVVYRDEDVTILRGRFPLTQRVGFSGPADTLAVLPSDERCSGVANDGVASLEFYPTGEPAFALLAEDGRCPVEGWIQPPQQAFRRR